MPFIAKTLGLGFCAAVLAVASHFPDDNVDVGAYRRGPDAVAFVVTNNGVPVTRNIMQCPDINDFTIGFVKADIRKGAVQAFRTKSERRRESFGKTLDLVSGPAVHQAVGLCRDRQVLAVT